MVFLNCFTSPLSPRRGGSTVHHCSALDCSALNCSGLDCSALDCKACRRQPTHAFPLRNAADGSTGSSKAAPPSSSGSSSHSCQSLRWKSAREGGVLAAGATATEAAGTQGNGGVLAAEAAETQGKGGVLAAEAVDTQGKSTALTTTAVETQGKGSVAPGSARQRTAAALQRRYWARDDGRTRAACSLRAGMQH